MDSRLFRVDAEVLPDERGWLVFVAGAAEVAWQPVYGLLGVRAAGWEAIDGAVASTRIDAWYGCGTVGPVLRLLTYACEAQATPGSASPPAACIEWLNGGAHRVAVLIEHDAAGVRVAARGDVLAQLMQRRSAMSEILGRPSRREEGQ